MLQPYHKIDNRNSNSQIVFLMTTEIQIQKIDFASLVIAQIKSFLGHFTSYLITFSSSNSLRELFSQKDAKIHNILQDT